MIVVTSSVAWYIRITCLSHWHHLQLTPSMAIYDTMQSLKSPVATQCVGYAYNLAAFLLAAGEKV